MQLPVSDMHTAAMWLCRSKLPSSAWCAQVFGTAALWGVGTAAGEIPPYAFSFKAAKAGDDNDTFDELFGIQYVTEQRNVFQRLVGSMQAWMLGVIERCAHLSPPTISLTLPTCFALATYSACGLSVIKRPTTRSFARELYNEEDIGSCASWLLWPTALQRQCCQSTGPRSHLPHGDPFGTRLLLLIFCFLINIFPIGVLFGPWLLLLI